jgi:hypothetical protein
MTQYTILSRATSGAEQFVRCLPGLRQGSQHARECSASDVRASTASGVPAGVGHHARAFLSAPSGRSRVECSPRSSQACARRNVEVEVEVEQKPLSITLPPHVARSATSTPRPRHRHSKDLNSATLYAPMRRNFARSSMNLGVQSTCSKRLAPLGARGVQEALQLQWIAGRGRHGNERE